jgi:phage shock protein A
VGIFDRFRRVVKSNINDMISKAENPEKMLNQLIIDMNQQLIESKKNVTSAIADEKRLERQLNQTRDQAASWEEKAMTALRAGREDMAREALERQKSLEDQAAEYHKQWQSHHASVEELKEALRGLQQKIDEAQRKKNLLIARSKRAEAQKRIQETIGGLSDTSAFEVFDRMTHKIDQMDAENEATRELIDFDTQDSLEKRFEELDGPSSRTDAMLEDLREKMKTRDEAGETARDSDSNIEQTLDDLKKKMQDEKA